MRGTSPSHHIRICSHWTVTLAAGMHDFIKKDAVGHQGDSDVSTVYRKSS